MTRVIILHYALLMIMRQDTKIENYVNCKRILAAFVVLFRAADLYFIIRVHIGNAINNDDTLSAVYASKHSLASGY